MRISKSEMIAIAGLIEEKAIKFRMAAENKDNEVYEKAVAEMEANRYLQIAEVLRTSSRLYVVE